MRRATANSSAATMAARKTPTAVVDPDRRADEEHREEARRHPRALLERQVDEGVGNCRRAEGRSCDHEPAETGFSEQPESCPDRNYTARDKQVHGGAVLDEQHHDGDADKGDSETGGEDPAVGPGGHGQDRKRNPPARQGAGGGEAAGGPPPPSPRSRDPRQRREPLS